MLEPFTPNQSEIDNEKRKKTAHTCTHRVYTPKAYHIFIEGRSFSTRRLQLAANNERRTNSTPTSPKTANTEVLTTTQRTYPKMIIKATSRPTADPSEDHHLQENSPCQRTIKGEDGGTWSAPRKASSWTLRRRRT
jgi:hypothetical protein